jgi:O-antigen ligase
MLHSHRHRRFHELPSIKPESSFPGADRKQPPPIHPLEKALLVVVAVHLVFLPWALGAMHVWSQCVSFVLSIVGLGLAIRTRDYSGEYSDEAPYQLHLLRKLLRFPIFWLGILFLAYIVIQALNPAWEYATDGQFWWIQGIPCIEWLPKGMRTPFDQASPWRSLMIYSSAWMSVCAVWTGFTRRKTLRNLLIVLAVNAFVLALLGLVQRADGASKIFWSWTPPAAYFVSSFIYRNHAGAYFDLLLAVTCALAFWFYRRQTRRQESSSPAMVFAFFAIVVAGIVLYSYSRGGTLLMLGFLAVVSAIFVRTLYSQSGSGRSPLLAVTLVAACMGFAGLGLLSLKTDQISDRMQELGQDIQEGEHYQRWMMAQATWEMAQDQLVTGRGAGSFRYYFPIIQAHYPELYNYAGTPKHCFWEHAHDDYLELLNELGIVGCALLAAGFLYYIVRLAMLRVWQNPPIAILLLGCLVTMVHATIDFPFFNPAILITWCCLWPVTIQWLEIERQSRGTTSR